MWTRSTLGDLCKMYQPKTISAKEMVADGQYVVYGANGIIGRYNKYNHEEPQLLVTCRGATCGAVNVSEPNSWINGNAMVIQPDLGKVSLRYMEYLFRGGIDLTSAITGAAQPQITRKSLEPIQLSYPPLEEQHRIVAKLDAVFAKIDLAIASANRAMIFTSNIYAKFIDSLFSDYATMAAPIGELSSINYGLTAKASLESGTHKFLRITDIQENHVDWSSVPYCEVDASAAEKYLLQSGDIVFARTGATTGKSYLVEKPEDAVFASYLIRVSVDRERLDPRYVMHYFQSAAYWKQISTGISGSAQGGFNATKLAALRIPLIPKNTQQSLIPKLDESLKVTRQLSGVYSQKIERLHTLRSTILAEAMRGGETA